MRVLVVEDVHRLADDIAEGMRDQGIAADISYDGPDALKKLAINAYDVVILDRDLPGVHGDVICRTIAEGDNAVMVLMLTASGTPGDRVTGLGLGADDYLSKPFHFPELVLRVRSLAQAQGQHAPIGAQDVRDRTRPVAAQRAARRRAVGAFREGTRRPRGADESVAWLPFGRGPARTGLGRKRRPFHQNCASNDQPVEAQARRAAGDRNPSCRRVPHQMTMYLN